MHDRFEKEVQKKMEELNLTPSAPVWEKIELEIRPEKKSRRVIFWLFFGLLFLGGGFLTYELFQPSKQSTSLVAVPDTKNNTTTQSAPTPLEENTITSEETTKENKPITVPASPNKKETHSGNVFLTGQENEVPVGKKNNGLKTIPKNENRKNRQSLTLKQQFTTTTIDEATPVNETGKVTNEPKPEMRKDIPATDTGTTAAPATITFKDSIIQPQEPKQVPSITTDTSVKKKIAANKEWKKKINSAVGTSGYGSISIFKGYAMNDAYASPSPAAGAGNGIVRTPSNVENGLAYSIGFSLARKLNDHFEVSFGLQYTHYSTSMNVGSNRRNDTIIQSSAGNFTADQYYTNTNLNNRYANRFHAIELPVTVSYKPVLSVPLLFSVGAAYGRLLSTNALTYSSASNLYYQDKDNYVRQMLP